MSRYQRWRGGTPEGVTDLYEILVHVRGRVAFPVDDDMTWRPATDAYETEDSFVVQMELAGMDPGAIEVVTDGQVLTIRGVRQDIAPQGKKHYHKMEINVGPFCRRIALPDDVVPGRAIARYQAGFLYVILPRGRRGTGDRRRIDVEP